MIELEKIIRKVNKYRIDNPFKEPKRIYITYTTYMRLLKEVTRDYIMINSDGIKTIFGMIVIVVPDDGALIE